MSFSREGGRKGALLSSLDVGKRGEGDVWWDSISSKRAKTEKKALGLRPEGGRGTQMPVRRTLLFLDEWGKGATFRLNPGISSKQKILRH